MHKPNDMHTESMLFKELRGGAAALALLALAVLAAPNVGAGRMLRQVQNTAIASNVGASGLGLQSSALPPPTSNNAATGGIVTGGQTSGFVPSTGLTTTGGVPATPNTLAPVPPALGGTGPGTGRATVPALVPAPAPAPLNIFNFIPTDQAVSTTAPQVRCPSLDGRPTPGRAGT